MRWMTGMLLAVTFGAQALAVTPGERAGVLLHAGAPPIPLTQVNGGQTCCSSNSIDAGGWSANWSGTLPTTIAPPMPFKVTRLGYNASAAAVTWIDTLYITTRIREAYPNQATADPSKVALNDFIYSTDGIKGVTNNSALTSPKPICNWDEPSRQLVSSTIHVGAVCFHRNARNGSEVAAIVFSATDGTTTVACTAGSMTKSTQVSGDQNAIIDYECSLNISSLTDNHLITVNAKAYPWIGASASIQDSSLNTSTQTGGGSVQRQFSPIYFLKNTTRAASPYLAFVCAQAGGSCAGAGNDATGLWSTTSATASGTPFATVGGALNAITSATQGFGASAVLDGAIIYVGTGTNTLNSATTNRPQNVATLTITHDPLGSSSNSVSFGAAAFAPKLGTSGSTLTSPITEGAIEFLNLTVTRTGAFTIGGNSTANLEIIFDNVAFANLNGSGGAENATWLATSHDYWYGGTLTNVGGAASATGASSNGEHRIWRGVNSDDGSTWEEWFMLGSLLRGSSSHNNLLSQGTRTADDSIVFGNFAEWPYASGDFWDVGGSENLPDGAAFVQNIVEVNYTTTSTVGLGIARDAGTSTATNLIVQYNTVTGWGVQAGRENFFYDEHCAPTDGTDIYRPHTLMDVRGNIFPQLYTKGDWFCGSVDSGPNAANHIGNWAFKNGTGSQGNLVRFEDTASGGIGSDRMQEYIGIGSIQGTSSTTDTVNPQFTNYQSTTWNGSALVVGAGGGDYHIGSTSPCKGAVAVAALPYGLDGSARLTTADSCGAYP